METKRCSTTVQAPASGQWSFIEICIVVKIQGKYFSTTQFVAIKRYIAPNPPGKFIGFLFSQLAETSFIYSISLQGHHHGQQHLTTRKPGSFHDSLRRRHSRYRSIRRLYQLDKKEQIRRIRMGKKSCQLNPTNAKSTCKACGWTDITLQRSDVMIAPHCCGDCGGEEFERQQQSRFETLVSNPFSLFRGF